MLQFKLALREKHATLETRRLSQQNQIDKRLAIKMRSTPQFNEILSAEEDFLSFIGVPLHHMTESSNV